MKGLKFVVVLSVLLSLVGCASKTIQQKRDILLNRAPQGYTSRDSGAPVNITELRNKLLSAGGEDDAFLRKLSEVCYEAPYFESGKCTLGFYLDEVEKIERQKREESCKKDISCSKDMEIFQAAQELNRVYYLVMARNPYDQSELDLNLRSLCRAAGVGQRGGIPLDQIRADVEQQPGLSPEIRGQFRDVAISCWKLSKNGVPDGTIKIKNLY